MDALDRIKIQLEERLNYLKQAKGNGKKIIGYIPGGYFPEEIALAADAIPVAMLRGGEHSAVEQSIAYVDRWVDTYYRAQIGYALSGEDPIYNLIDALVVPITDANNRALSDTLAYHSDLELILYGVPHTKSEAACDYYRHGLQKVADNLSQLSGIHMTDQSLQEAAEKCNRERELLKELAVMRQSGNTSLGAADFVMINHASMLVDKDPFIENLVELINELKGAEFPAVDGPRILLTGSTLARGDHKVINMVEASGASIVVEEFAEGIKPFLHSVKLNGNPVNAIAKAYFMDRVAPAWFRPGTELPEHLIQLATDCAADGVIWYQLLYRESYKIHSSYFPEMLKKQTGLSMLTLDSDYDPAETGQMATRIETYIESIRG
jgi:benzoyl-CoA reductase/2-hydroxyglutaryl-CoA dehydratase subunit BcrC/BadD/HgdB